LAVGTSSNSARVIVTVVIVSIVVAGLTLATVRYWSAGEFMVLGAVDLVLSFVFYRFGLLQFVFLSLIGEPLLPDDVGFTAVKILGVVMTLAGGPPPRLVGSAPGWCALLLVGAVMVSLLASRDLTEGATALLTYVQLLILLFLMIDYLQGQREIEQLMAVFVASGLLNAGLALHEFHFGTADRAEGIARNPNQFAMIQVLLICLMVPLIGQVRTKWLSVAALAAAGPIAYSIFLSLSRGAIVAVAGATLYYFFGLRMGDVRRKVLVVLGCAIALWLAPDEFYDRMESIPRYLSAVTVRRDTSIETRLTYYAAGVQMGLDHFWTGVGVRQFDRHILSYARLGQADASGAHNMYVSVFAETGGIGAISFLGFVGTGLLAARRVRLLRGRGRISGGTGAESVELALVALLVGGSFGSFEYSKVLWMLIGFAVALDANARSEMETGIGEVMHPEPPWPVSRATRCAG
jgi:O-antigen ligase